MIQYLDVVDVERHEYCSFLVGEDTRLLREWSEVEFLKCTREVAVPQSRRVPQTVQRSVDLGYHTRSLPAVWQETRYSSAPLVSLSIDKCVDDIKLLHLQIELRGQGHYNSEGSCRQRGCVG